MENSKKFGIAAAVLGGATLCLVMAQVADSAIATIRATTETPTIHMDAENNYFFESVLSFDAVSGTSKVTTGYGNTVAMEYSDFIQARTAGNWHLIGPGGYFGNTDWIMGLTSISFSTSGAGTAEVSWSADGKTFSDADKEPFTVEKDGTYTCYFGNDDPNYFRLGNTASSGNVAITSIDIAFACVDYYSTITVEPNDAALGTVKAGGAHKIGSTVSLEATPVDGGSTFVGWYEGTKLLSQDNPYSYTVPSYDAAITAKFEAAKYNLVVASEDTEMGSVSINGGDYLYSESVTVSAIPNEGYSFVGWYKDGTNVSTSKEYTFTMPAEPIALSARFEAISYYVSLTEENSSMGYVSDSGYHDYKSSVTVTARTYSGYSFVGWFENGESVSSSGSYTFSMPARDVTLVAKWSTKSYAVTVSAAYVGSDGETAYGTVTGSGTYAYDSRQIATAIPNDGFAFLGWYKGDSLISENESYSYYVPVNGLTLVAKFSKKYSVSLTPIQTSGTTIGIGEYAHMQEVTVGFIPKGVSSGGVYSASFLDGTLSEIASGLSYTFTMPESDVDLYCTLKTSGLADVSSVCFGSYPQTCVTDDVLISTLSAVEDADNDGYIEYDGKEYLKTAGSGENGYSTSTTYYFEVEPITWKYYDGMLIAEKIIDASVYYTSTSSRSYGGGTVYANNYEYSTVRAYLNGLNGSDYKVGNFSGVGFIDKAFTADEQAMIKADTVDNSAATTDSSSNSYACADTKDKIFLLSYQDALNADYGYSTSRSSSDTRVKKCTDYALYRELYYYNSFTGAGYWWLRSPRSDDSLSAWFVSSDGYVYGNYVYYCYGLSPALRITL